MRMELEELKQWLKAKIYLISLRAKLKKKYQIGKHQAMMAYMGTGLKNSLPSIRNSLS